MFSLLPCVPSSERANGRERLYPKQRPPLTVCFVAYVPQDGNLYLAQATNGPAAAVDARCVQIHVRRRNMRGIKATVSDTYDRTHRQGYHLACFVSIYSV